MMIDTTEFVKELKSYGVMWCEDEQQHLIGDVPLTNKDMKIMCSHKFGDEYNDLNNTNKTKVRINVFNKIRYGDDYEKRIK